MIPKVGQIWQGHNSGSHYEVISIDTTNKTFKTETVKAGHKTGAKNGARWTFSNLKLWGLVKDVEEEMEIKVGQLWESGGTTSTLSYKILEIESSTMCTIQETKSGRIFPQQHSEYIKQYWHLLEEEEEVDMSFDEIAVDNHYGQIKLFENTQTKYEIGSVLPDLGGVESYSIAMKEGGFVNVNQGILVSWTDTPGHRNAVYSKTGALLSSGDPDQDIWMEEHLEEEGYFYNPDELAKIIKGVHSQQKEAPEEKDFDQHEEADEEFEPGEMVALFNSDGKYLCLAEVYADHRGTGDKYDQVGALFTLSRSDGGKGTGLDGGWAIDKTTLKTMTTKGVRYCDNCGTHFYDPSE